jgi:hypothetical protein
MLALDKRTTKMPMRFAPVDLVVPVRWLTGKHSKPLSANAALLLAYLVWFDEQGNLDEERWFARSPAPRFSVNDPSGWIITLQERGLVAGCFAAVVD